MSTPQPLLPLDRTFDALYGLEVIESNEELVRAQVKVRDEIKQPMGLVHGGIYASIAESITSTATAMAVWPEGKAAQGMSNQTSFLRPIMQGTIRLCALVRMTIAVREIQRR
jgi:1,4-dihydroxy-2-naphthoyl-CoA hydrolase